MQADHILTVHRELDNGKAGGKVSDEIKEKEPNVGTTEEQKDGNSKKEEPNRLMKENHIDGNQFPSLLASLRDNAR